MYLVDFIFDGLRLSNFGCMVGSAVTGNSDSLEMGSVIELETAINRGSYISEIYDANYPNVYTTTFDIFKKPCGGGFGDVFEDKEISWFMRWLNRKEYKKFIPIFDTPKDFYMNYFMGTFTDCKAINIQGQVYGFTLTFTSNSPFAYLDYKPITFDILNKGESFKIVNPYTKEQSTLTGGTFTIYDESEELGAVYPKSFVVKMTETFSEPTKTLIIKNDRDKSNRYTEVKGCIVGEEITFDCIHKIIHTSVNAHLKTLYNDFNYVYPRLTNDFYERSNKFHVTINGTVTIDYNPIRKVGAFA